MNIGLAAYILQNLTRLDTNWIPVFLFLSDVPVTLRIA